MNPSGVSKPSAAATTTRASLSARTDCGCQRLTVSPFRARAAAEPDHDADRQYSRDPAVQSPSIEGCEVGAARADPALAETWDFLPLPAAAERRCENERRREGEPEDSDVHRHCGELLVF
jgi:hypothetical protein